MGIVAGQAAQCAVTLLETAALLQSVRMMIDFKPIVGWPIAIHNVQWDDEIRKWLTRHERIVVAAEAADAKQRYRGLQMALVTDIVAKVGLQLGGVHDVGFGRRPGRVELDVIGARTVAALAPDSVWQAVRKRLRRPIGVGLPRDFRIGVMAKEAFAANATSDTFVVWPVISGRHAPSLLFGIPGNRYLI